MVFGLLATRICDGLLKMYLKRCIFLGTVISDNTQGVDFLLAFVLSGSLGLCGKLCDYRSFFTLALLNFSPAHRLFYFN